MSHSDKYCLNMKITHGQPWSWLVQRRIVTTIVSMFKSIPLGSPITLVYNIKPLGLLVLLVYNMNNRSMPSMIKCHILINIVSIWKSPMANHGHSWSNVALWQKSSRCLNQFPWVHQFLWFIIWIIGQCHPWSNVTFWQILSQYENHPGPTMVIVGPTSVYNINN